MASETQYLRRAGELARYVDTDVNDSDSDSDSDNNYETLLQQRLQETIAREKLRYGDIIYNSDGFRASETYYVDECGKAAQIGDYGQGSGSIDIEVTRLIEDPVEFFGSRPKGDIVHMWLDASAHAALLRRATGGRPVHASRQVQADNYGCGEWRLLIASPRSLDIAADDFPGGLDFDPECELSEETPDVYLADADTIDTDPIVETLRAENRVRADEIASSASVGDDVTLARTRGNWASFARITKVVRGGELAIHEIHVEHEWKMLIFTRRLIAPKYGRYGGVLVWATADDMILSKARKHTLE